MARRNTSELAFTAIRIEGGLLAADFLGRVAHLQAQEQSEADYDIPKGLKLRDEIGRYWKIAQNLWQDFQAGRQRVDHDAHIFTVREFLEPLCRQVLGFADLQQVGRSPIVSVSSPSASRRWLAKYPWFLRPMPRRLKNPTPVSATASVAAPRSCWPRNI